MPFSAGDQVQLKSGGPVMTVVKYGDSGYVLCRWFDGNTPRSESFLEPELRPYVSPLDRNR